MESTQATPNRSPRVLVTGGAGFIGGNFIHHLLTSSDAAIANLDLLTYAGHRETLADIEQDPRYRFVHGDIADPVNVQHLIEDFRPTCIVNFAAESHVDRSIAGPEDFIQTNVVGTFRLLEAARAHWGGLEDGDAFRFLHASTDEVYGSLEPGDPAFSETSRVTPNSPYSATKAASDHLARSYHHTYGLPVLISNCSNNYGPYQ
ncbi:MAG: GDP-mannose 4,6-dehydratase, partial [Gammaproteobacteria bacterium]|nr:GDP-mannose 4,6-dehydratase [Gammaproteobacteria bacterium]